jgi:hypothetical protein
MRKLKGGVGMKNLVRYSTLVVLFLALSAFTSNNTVEGSWIGEFTAIDQSIPITVHFWQENGDLKGTISLSDRGTKEFPLSWIVVEASSVHFEFVQECGTLVFDGVLKDGKISGNLLCSNFRGQFQLAPANLVNL